jgi:hypothetical protein
MVIPQIAYGKSIALQTCSCTHAKLILRETFGKKKGEHPEARGFLCFRIGIENGGYLLVDYPSRQP